MTDKVDVVICFYRNERLWPFVAWGLAQNQDHIGTVIISNDEPWGNSSRVAIEIASREARLTVPLKFIDHPRQGMRQTQCFNDGVAAATAEDILQIDDDIVLAPNCISTFLAASGYKTLLTGRLHDIPRCNLTTSMLKDPPILKVDKRLIAPHITDLWLHVRDSFLFYNRADYLAIGGHDESYQDGQEYGYGYVDYDFGLRWFKEFGQDSFEMTDAVAYHMSGLERGHQFSQANQARFKGKLQEYTGNMVVPLA